jgi:hypothetical protein
MATGKLCVWSTVGYGLSGRGLPAGKCAIDASDAESGLRRCTRGIVGDVVGVWGVPCAESRGCCCTGETVLMRSQAILLNTLWTTMLTILRRATQHAWKDASKTKWARVLFVLQDSAPLMINGKHYKEDLSHGDGEIPSSGNDA